MKSNSILKLALGVVAAACTLFSAVTGHAASFHINLNTSSLVGSGSSPFALDFQLNNGGGLLSNTATISNFTFGGGALSLSPAPVNIGLGSGSLASTVTLGSDSLNSFNEFYQGFTPGSVLGFDVSLSGNINTPTPDLFAVSILDSALANITTTGLGDTLALVNLDSASPTVQSFTGTGAFSGVTVDVTPVPEPATISVGLALGLVGAAARRRVRAA